MSDLIGSIHCMPHLDLAAALTAAGQRVDALIVDCPYGARTHDGHDGAAAAEPGATWVRANGRVEAKIVRREIDYPPWTPDDVQAFLAAWLPIVDGWIVSITDDNLFPHWRAGMEAAGRQTFQDVPATVRGMGVRLNGDGPSSWAVHCAVSRPRSLAMAKWGTLDGGYGGPSEKQDVVGGKPLWLMRALVRDYSRPGDLVCDPCAGAGTTLVAAKMSGRRFVGSDIDAAHVEIARKRLSETVPCDHMGTPMGDAKGKSLALFGKDVLR